jgi:DNA-binding response OmpR family regulator
MATEKIIALIDDDEDILNFLNYNLVKKGYKVILFSALLIAIFL